MKTKHTASQIREHLQNNQSILGDLKELLEFLPYCEYELILFMEAKNVWSGFFPSPPSGFAKGDGAIELGLFLYWFNHVDQLDLSVFPPETQKHIKEFIVAVSIFMPSTQLDLVNYSYFKTNELIYEDGTVLSMEKFANFDQNWFIAFLNLLESLINNTWYNGGTFPTTTPPSVPLSGKNPNQVTIAIFGDWGAGNQAAKSVMQSIVNLQPDYLVHVGDVYYAGTPVASHPVSKHYYQLGEEVDNLMNLWPPNYTGKSFTLNSNHEMYSGANGLFLDALGAQQTPPGSLSYFSAQKGASCFSMKFGDWTILGLDSAYRSSILTAFMTGGIGGPSEFQTKWIHGLGLNPNKTIVMSHHNGFADDCTSVSPLWAEVKNALGGDPYAWYWGHVHNGIVYNRPISIPTTKSAPGITTNTFARCLGHASLPYGHASSLDGKPIEYQANSPRPAPSKELYQGFALLTLTMNNGVVDNISEGFYDISGAPSQPRYFRRIL